MFFWALPLPVWQGGGATPQQPLPQVGSVMQGRQAGTPMSSCSTCDRQQVRFPGFEGWCSIGDAMRMRMKRSSLS